jgi:hypothetical protein
MLRADSVTPSGRTIMRMMVGKGYLLLNVDSKPHGDMLLLTFQVFYL